MVKKESKAMRTGRFWLAIGLVSALGAAAPVAHGAVVTFSIQLADNTLDNVGDTTTYEVWAEVTDNHYVDPSGGGDLWLFEGGLMAYGVNVNFATDGVGEITFTSGRGGTDLNTNLNNTMFDALGAKGKPGANGGGQQIADSSTLPGQQGDPYAYPPFPDERHGYTYNDNSPRWWAGNVDVPDPQDDFVGGPIKLFDGVIEATAEGTTMIDISEYTTPVVYTLMSDGQFGFVNTGGAEFQSAGPVALTVGSGSGGEDTTPPVFDTTGMTMPGNGDSHVAEKEWDVSGSQGAKPRWNHDSHKFGIGGVDVSDPESTVTQVAFLISLSADPTDPDYNNFAWVKDLVSGSPYGADITMADIAAALGASNLPGEYGPNETPDPDVYEYQWKITATSEGGTADGPSGTIFVPEPTTMVMLTMGGFAALIRRRRRA